MRMTRQVVGVIMVTSIAAGGGARDGRAQYGVTASLPASSVIMSGSSDSWHSRGGVVGPWWSGSGPGAMPPAANGGFWFGTPEFGFGGAQGSTRGMNTFAASVTSTQGAPGMVSSSRLVPFVAGVVPIVGSGYPLTPMTTRAYLGASPDTRPVNPLPSRLHDRSRSGSPATAGSRPSTPQARSRAQELVAAADRLLREATETHEAAKAALHEYRSAARFAQDDADLEIRQAMIQEALGKRRDADRAIDRATRIDARLALPLEAVPADAGGFLATAPPGMPAAAARGFAILREMTVMPNVPESPAASSTRPAVVEWLAEAWSLRWGLAEGSAMLDTP